MRKTLAFSNQPLPNVYLAIQPSQAAAPTGAPPATPSTAALLPGGGELALEMPRQDGQSTLLDASAAHMKWLLQSTQ